LLGTNAVPMDCHLLVIPGPKDAISSAELERIEQYLTQGGRLLALFNFLSAAKETGLEKILLNWGVVVGTNVVEDLENTSGGSDLIVSDFSKHLLVNPLLGSGLHLIRPRAVSKTAQTQVANAPQVEEIAFSGPKAFVKTDPAAKARFPLLVAVEKGAIKGVITERGTTRILVAGDSIFLANHQIESAANRDFAHLAANWLLDRTQLVQGLRPRRVTEYRILMTQTQLQRAQWLLLGGMPGSVLLLGGLVWLRRRR
jgi:hypothetical protein